MVESTVQLSSTMTRALCSVYHRVMPATRAELVCEHGPVGNCCLGSCLPPAPSGLHLSPGNSATAPLPSFLPALPSQNQEPEGSSLFGPPHLVKTVKRISHTSWEVAARKMAAILLDVISLNTASSWDCLYCFATRCLRTPKWVGHHRSLATQLNWKIYDEVDPDLSASLSNANYRTETLYNL